MTTNKIVLVKISIITVVYNGEQHLRDCITSVLAQDYSNLEYILIDGASNDGSFEIAKEFQKDIDVLISEPDLGMYDALNKGIALAKGDVIGILNADDMLVARNVISQVAKCFTNANIDGVYGDLNYVDADNIANVRRKWRSKNAVSTDLALGWMPAHPTLYLKKSIFLKYGNYKLNFGSAADYELMLRMLYQYRVNSIHLPVLMVNMRNGGMSNQSLKHRFAALKNDYAALKANRVPFPLLPLVLKKLRKLSQFFS